MTQQPFSSSALRGAVDLSSLGRAPGAQRPAGGAAAAQSAPPGAAPVAASDDGVLVHATDATFTALVTATTSVPAVLVLWAEQFPGSGDYLQVLAAESRARQGRFTVIGVDLAASPAIVQALTPLLQQEFGQVSQLPAVLGLLQGQPVPFFLGAQPLEQVRPLLDQFLDAAVANGVTGRVPGVQEQPEPEPAPEEGDTELPPRHQEAYDAIERGDLGAATVAYERALAEQPTDEQARLGLGQVALLRRTQDLDPTQVRAAAAADPADVDAQLQAADLDLAGGHVEDSFGRLVEAVRRTSGPDRERIRARLLELFDVVGAGDPAVATARRALMSALF